MDEPEETPPAENPTSADSSQIAPQRRTIRKRPDGEGAAKGKVAAEELIAFLGGLYSQSQGGGAGAPPGNAEGTQERGPSVLQARRLPRTGGTGGGASATPPGSATSAEPGLQPEASAPTPVLATMKPRASRPAPAPVRRGRLVGWLVVTCLALAGAGAAFWWWQHRPAATNQEPGGAAPGVAASVPGTRALLANEEALEIVDRVLGAVAHGEIKEAASLLADAQQRGVPLPGLRYQAALLALNLGEFIPAKNLLDESIDLGDAVPECCYLRASTEAGRGDYKAASEGFLEAVKAAPFNPRYRFFLAESLRRQGSPTQAIKQFEEALQCRPSVADGELIIFKLNLAHVEADNDPEFNQDLVNRLAQENAPVSVLLFGVAREINRADYAAATAYLQRAAKAAPPGVLSARLRDYCFRLPPQEKERTAEWAALTQPPPVTTPLAQPSPSPAEATAPAPRRPVVDPATRSMAESDPAAW